MKKTQRRPEQMAPAVEDVPVRAREDRIWMLGLALASWAALAVGAVLGRRFDYNLWDNFEYFTPILDYTHGLWLQGIVPLWNPHQHLGEPLLAAGQPGVLYFPYTLGVLVTRVLGLGPTRLMLVIVLLHLPLAALGWFLLARRLGARPSIAAVAALSASLGGFVTAVSTVWIFMMPVFAWLPWVLYGIVRQLGDPGRGGAAALVTGLVATACVGHPQLLIYQWLAAVVFLAGFFLVFRNPARLIGIFALMALAVVLSLPALLPMAELYPLSVRTQSFSIEAFMLRGVSPLALVGWLLPVFNAANGFLPDRASVMAYQGAWIVPGVAAGTIGLAASLRTPLGRAFCVCGLAAALLLALATGGHSPLYRATYGIPVWSSLRWPFKLFMMSQGALAIVAALGLEMWTRRLPGIRWLRGVPVALFAFGAWFAFRSLGVERHMGGAAVVGLVGAAATLAALPWLDHRWATVLFAAGAFTNAASLTAGAHDMGMKTYTEPYGRFGAREFGLQADARVLPLTSQDAAAPSMQPLALLHSATANGYLGATGTAAGLIPTWYAATLPCNVFGVPPPQVLLGLLGSHLLRSYNIGYLVFDPRDSIARDLVARAGGSRLLRSNRDAVVFEVEGVLPRAYFASRTYAFDEERFERGMILNESAVDAAFIGGWTGPEASPAGRVTSAHWGESRIALDVDAPEGGFLVVAISDFPGWTCRVDGVRAPIARVNGRVMGIALPRGARRVRLELRSNGLEWGLWAALLGGLLAVTATVVVPRARAARTRRAIPRA